jgi:hypothetical protein
MSISSGNIGMIDKAKKKLGLKWPDIKMCELGNQKILAKDKNGKDYRKCSAKEYYTRLGANHVSMDINGKDGAIVVDLCQPVEDAFLNRFNLLTNYGTTEHVEKQYVAFRNIHNMVEVGGVMVHSIPLVGSWRGHCPYHYSNKFPEYLRDVCQYKIVYKAIQKRHNRETAKLLNFIVQKTCEEFPELDAKSFEKEIDFTNHFRQDSNNKFKA